MANYNIEVSKSAEKQLKKLPSKDLLRVIKAMESLSFDPLPIGSKKLQGYSDVYRLRVGIYRILYSLDDSTITIIILKVGHRKDVYR